MNRRFVKLFYWAGAKYWMRDLLLDCLPMEYGDIYIPFAGRLDYLQILRSLGIEKHVFASDVSLRLAMAHNGVRDFCEDVIPILEEHRRYHSDDYYLAIRDRFSPEMPLAEASADFTYISRNSYRGVIRMSADGRCTNVNARPNFNFDPEDVREHSRFLRNTTIVAEDYSSTVKRAKPGDLVFLDPPYQGSLVHGCLKFPDNAHYRLRDVCNELDRRGVLFLMTNGPSPYIRHIYRDYRIEGIEAPRILGRAKNGGRDTELLITNYARILARHAA